MGKRRTLVVGLLLTAIAIGVWLMSGPAARTRLRVENYPQVRTGQTQAEVEELLGGPPGNYGRYARGNGIMSEEGYWAPPGSAERIWCDDSTRFEIYFDATGRAVGHHKRAGYSQSPSEGVFAGLWRQLGL